ncbi:MAG: aminoglycoside phosphotransferase family protein [Chloroflexi bacterium]|nr:aminoglycoside phosphotransferase family protein [Chloroflexota bacterium]
MTPVRMHADEIDTDETLVARLLAAQFPQWAGLPIRRVPSSGTDNALYRLGEGLVARLPRIHWAAGQVDKDHHWLPRIAPHLPLAIPAPLAVGEPGAGYPYRWAIHRWLEGENATVDDLADPAQAARDLARFILALRRLDPTGGPDDVYRGKPLAARDRHTREAIAASAARGLVDAQAATAAWEAALRAPAWDRPPAWFHGDLMPGNLLFVRGRLSAIIDFGALGVGDPACDLIIAWGFFSGASREAFRAALAVDDAAWARGRGWALSIGLVALPYYIDTNPGLAGVAKRQIEQALADQPGCR